ncbi:sensor histidine kinase [Egicoccus sp. AB-alg6-2]|uniref:sensor histidine kinase n=1 Tax=Egicoccus sp. AB-alg6-2 TaxID=3242692 RepID=UPI00359CD8B0
MDDDEQRDLWEATAAAVAHELATPLAATQAAIRLLAAAESDDEREQLSDAALRNLQLLELQVRRLQQLDAAAPAPAVQPGVDLAALVRETVEDLALTTLGDHPTTVEAPGQVVLEADPNQLRQVLFNLLSNAAKYSPAGRDIVIDVEPGADEVMLRVRDRGEGVAPEDADRIFERYERAATDHQGAGLGLYLSRRIARAHGGDLHLVPAEGEGAVFELVLPTRQGGGATRGE